NKTAAAGRELALGLRKMLGGVDSVDIAVCPTAAALSTVSEVLSGSNIGVGAQNMHWENNGAYTGEISGEMVKEFAEYVIIGHSERRQLFGETDVTVNQKIKAALAHGLSPIVCIGESLDQNKAGETVSFVGGQIRGAFADIAKDQAQKITLAYEPIWAIGTGLTATPEAANDIVKVAIRDVLAELYDDHTAQMIRVQYGGSVKPDNMAAFIVMENIDGALVGGASLKAESFTAIIQQAIDAFTA
ncbi:MAG: triose-phosphate isomerase, partial [Anaerolineae bacterium]|nr:triose-phosphate isomerase [Anaerolineae bacterium]